jgi:hypothetical protein
MMNQLKYDTVSFQANLVQDEKLITKIENFHNVEISQDPSVSPEKFQHRCKILNTKKKLFNDILNGTKKWPGVRKKVELALAQNSHYSFQDLMKDLNIPKEEKTAFNLFANEGINKKGHFYFTESLVTPIINTLGINYSDKKIIFNSENKPLIGKRLLEKITGAKKSLNPDQSEIHRAKYLLLEKIEKFVQNKLKTNTDYDNYCLRNDLGIPDELLNSWRTFLKPYKGKNNQLYYPETLLSLILNKLNIAEQEEFQVFNFTITDKLDQLREGLNPGISDIYKAKYGLILELEKFVQDKLKTNPDYNYSSLLDDLNLPEDQINSWKNFINPEIQKTGGLNYTYNLVTPILKKLELENRIDLNLFSEKKGHLTGQNFLNRLILVKKGINRSESKKHRAKYCLIEQIEKFVRVKLKKNPNYSHLDFVKEVKIPDSKVNIWLHFINHNRQSTGALYYTKDIVDPILKALKLETIKEFKCYRGRIAV